MRKSVIKIYFFIGLIGALYLIFIKLTGLSIPCLGYELTGLLCPGCGTTRMFLNLSKLRFADAFLCNPMVFSLLVLWLIISLFCFFNRPKFIANKKFLYIMMYLSIFSLFIFGILRNFA